MIEETVKLTSETLQSDYLYWITFYKGRFAKVYYTTCRTYGYIKTYNIAANVVRYFN